jgi:hypothetical protein
MVNARNNLIKLPPVQLNASLNLDVCSLFESSGLSFAFDIPLRDTLIVLGIIPSLRSHLAHGIGIGSG